ncbi:MAG: sigma-70 family RNA polymerase sigma factor [Deltaproteobacteria bacterium]|nr:sigma-70 family RNA polymerase sigma factor [Deltaproteobacteria bacterium]
MTLLEDIRADRPGAWKRLFEKYAGVIYRWGILLGLRPAEAEDLAQEVLVVASRKLDQCRDDQGLTPWLYRITRHLAANLRRKAWFRRCARPDYPPGKRYMGDGCVGEL